MKHKKHKKKEDKIGHYESAEPMHGIDSHKKNWIAGAIKHPGSLRKELHVKKGHKIPEKALEKATHHKGKEGKRARLAITLKRMHKKGK